MLDTQVWLDLLVFEDPAVAPLRAALAEGTGRALACDAMHAEFERVLAYPALRLDATARSHHATAMRSLSAPVPTPCAAPMRCRDPDDQVFVDLALAERADALLSRDNAILAMARRLANAGIDVTTPAAWCAAQISKR